MTYAYHCQSCGFNITISDDGEGSSEGEWGMKQSCCHKCSNSECKDYGECNCTLEMIDRHMELIRKKIEEGTHPLLFPPDEEE